MNEPSLAWWGLMIALFGLVSPALVYLGIRLGTLQQSTDGAHKRIDRLEQLLTTEFRALRAELRTSIEESWRNCPLAHGKDKH